MTGESVIYRYEVPVDDAVHEIECSAPLFVASRDPRVVEFWAYPDGPEVCTRRFIVVGTGHPLPSTVFTYRGSAIAAGGALVWHLLEIT